MKLLPEKKRRAVINITPLVDVLFILIIFFAVTSTFLERPGMKLELPKAYTGKPQRVEQVVLSITADEILLLNGKPTDLEHLGAALREQMRQQPQHRLIIQADKRVPHGLVVRVMDIARQSGVEKLVIATEPGQ